MPALIAMGSIAPARVNAQGAELRAVERKVVLGGLDVPAWQAFSREPQILALPGGGAAILAPDGAGVVMVSASGQRIRQVGRKGEGPGEFQVVAGFGVVGDTLWLRNWPDPRISQFDLDGTHLRTWRRPLRYGETYSAPQGITGLLRGGYRFATPDGVVLGRPARSPTPVLLLREGSEVVDTILTRPGFDGLVVERLGTFQLRPFSRAPLMSPLPDGAGLLIAAWSDGPDVTFTRLDPTGHVVDRFSRSFARVPVPRRVLTALVDSGVAMARAPYEWARQRGRPVPSDLRAAVEEGLDAPEYFPPVQDMFVAADGNTWLRLATDGVDSDWLVLGPEGEELWRLRAPGGVRFRAASGMSVWGTWVGDLDIPYAGRFEVVPARR